MKKYIYFNTEKKDAKNESEKRLFKLMNNSTYGKAMENLRKRINVRLANIAKEFLKYVSKPTFISQKIVSKDFAATHETCYNKPIYVEFTVLELSIYLMYEYILNVYT